MIIKNRFYTFIVTLVIFMAFSVQMYAVDGIREKFEQMCVKEKLWDRVDGYDRFKRADEISGLKFSTEQKDQWNALVSQSDQLLDKLKKFNDLNNGLLVVVLKKEDEKQRLLDQMNLRSRQLMEDVEKSPEYKALKKQEKLLDEDQKRIFAKADPIKKEIKETTDKMRSLQDEVYKLKLEQQDFIENDVEYQKKMEEIEKKHGGPSGIVGLWFDAKDELVERIKRRYEQANEKYKTMGLQIKKLEEQMVPLREKIKPQEDKIRVIEHEAMAVYPKQRAIFQQLSALGRQYIHKDKQFNDWSLQIDKLRKEQEPYQEKVFDCFRWISKNRNLTSRLGRIFRVLISFQKDDTDIVPRAVVSIKN